MEPYDGSDYLPPNLEVTSPQNGLYLWNTRFLPFLFRQRTIIFGAITIEVDASDDQSGIRCVKFYVDNELKAIDATSPYSWTWDERTPLRFRHTIKVMVYDNSGNKATNELNVWSFYD